MNLLIHKPYQRGGGILLHPTSLPGPFGIGDLGPSASRFIDFLEQAGMSYWQMLPLVPVMDEFSPYQSTSAMAGNPLLISPELLLEEGLVRRGSKAFLIFQRNGSMFPWFLVGSRIC